MVCIKLKKITLMLRTVQKMVYSNLKTRANLNFVFDHIPD